MARALEAQDLEALMGCCSDQLVYDDRRRIGGDVISGTAQYQVAWTRVLEQYNHFQVRVLAVRGEKLNLNWTRWSDDAGNETVFLHVCEVDDDGRLKYGARFDEDDFEGAYRELDRRYYAGEGAAFAEPGAMVTDWLIAMNNGNFDQLFGELSTADMRVENRSRSALPDLSAAELRVSFEDLDARVASTRTMLSALCWVSSTVFVGRFEREAVGHDDEQYSWTRLAVNEIHDGRLASACQFEIDDEEVAFAYAEERMRANTSRLAVRNKASAATEIGWRAMEIHDPGAVVAIYADQFVYDDHRRLRGDPIESADAMRPAVERMAAQYPHVDWRTLAVRGERLVLHQSRFSDDAGNETAYLHVREVGDEGRVIYDGRFAEDDFEGAYR
jgi:hypothetical protein